MTSSPVSELESSGAAAPRQGRGHAWIMLPWLVVAAFAVVTLWRSHVVDIPVRDPHLAYFWGRVGMELGLVAPMLVVDAWWRARRHGERFVTVVRTRWTARRIGLVVAAVVVHQLTYLLYHNLKSWDVFNPLQDDLLLRWDTWLFFGHSPYRLVHALLGQKSAAYVLMVIYESFSTILIIAFAAALVFVDEIRDSYVYVTASMWCWILGVGSYYLIPSTGPFHIVPEDFAGLPHTMIQDTQARYYAQREYLLAHPHASDAFAQISAFASLHVALVAMVMLMARYYRLRRTSWVLAAYLVGTIVATIYLGWHYVVDDVAGLAIAFLAVTLGRRMCYPSGREGEPAIGRARW